MNLKVNDMIDCVRWDNHDKLGYWSYGKIIDMNNE